MTSYETQHTHLFEFMTKVLMLLLLRRELPPALWARGTPLLHHGYCVEAKQNTAADGVFDVLRIRKIFHSFLNLAKFDLLCVVILPEIVVVIKC